MYRVWWFNKYLGAWVARSCGEHGDVAFAFIQSLLSEGKFRLFVEFIKRNGIVQTQNIEKVVGVVVGATAPTPSLDIEYQIR